MRKELRAISFIPGYTSQYATNTYGSITWDYVIDADSSYRPVAMRTSIKKDGSCGFELNSAALDLLYPNAVAKPVSANIQMATCRASSTTTVYATVWFNGQYVHSAGSYGQDTQLNATHNITNAEVVNYIRPTIKVGLWRDGGGSGAVSCNLMYGRICLFYNCPEFKANKNNGIMNASTSEPFCFTGDKVRFECSLKPGATFDGWYDSNGNKYKINGVDAPQTFTITAGSADVILEARATMPQEKTVVIAYGNGIIYRFNHTDAIVVRYGNKPIAILTPNNSFTLECANTMLTAPIYIDNYKIDGMNKIMTTDIEISYS